MKVHVISAFHELFAAYLKEGVVGTAIGLGKLELALVNPRNFTGDVHRTIDDRPFGGGDGMVMLIEPLKRALNSISNPGRVVYLSPQGGPWSHKKAQQFAELESVTLLCGRYGGVDERFIQTHVDEEVSIGDYVLSGGELGALVMIDSMARFIPGVLGNQQSVHADSFGDGLLEAPLFTRPRNSQTEQSVPDILLSGHHEKIRQWRRAISLLRTRVRRPDLLEQTLIDEREWAAAEKLYISLSIEERRLLGVSQPNKLENKLENP